MCPAVKKNALFVYKKSIPMTIIGNTGINASLKRRAKDEQRGEPIGLLDFSHLPSSVAAAAATFKTDTCVRQDELKSTPFCHWTFAAIIPPD